MTEVVERTLSLLREGTLPVLLPLILVCLGIWVLILERGAFLYGPSFLWWWWPPMRRELASRRARLTDAFDAYLNGRTQERRARLIEACRRLTTPYTAFLSRAVEEEVQVPPEVRDLQLGVAGLYQELEIERGLPLLSTLAKVAPLLGLLGTVIGMIQTFRVMMLASTSDPRALSSGISIALIATLVGLVVALPGVVGTSWLSRRAQTLLEEIQVASLRLQQFTGAPGGNSSP